MKLFNSLNMLLVVFVLVAGCENKQEQNEEQGASLSPSEHVEQASFEDLEGNIVELSDFRGKVVMIDFWETWCKPCIDSFPTMQKLMEDYPEDFVVLAVTPGFTDTEEDARKFISKHDYSFVYLLDENNLHQKLEVQSIPYKVFVDAEGNYIESSIGSYGPEEDYEKVRQIIEKHKSS